MTSPIAVSVEGVSKRYGDFQAVSDLSFQVAVGEIFAILGPNGAGKSTTIRMILDILKPDSGRIAVFGAPITDKAKDRIGYLPEERGLYRNVPVLEMMVYLGTLKGMTRAAAKTASMALLERLELAEHHKKKVSELSKGMQQKVQFAVTILHDPDLIIIDEPFSGLDPVNTLVIKDLLLDFARRDKAVMMSTHQMYQVEEMAGRMLMIDRGRLALYGTVNEVRQEYALPAVRVEGSGEWDSLRTVDHIEMSDNGRGEVTLYLKNGADSDDLMAEIAARSDVTVRRFELAVPTLNEIFVDVVQNRAAPRKEAVTHE
ncbi:MAG: ATP-binding cassette domain-containing protein [Chloroflexota bacterium]|nr:ATP-binding cassette domain-containing protein [Chloroflexota bacterium]